MADEGGIGDRPHIPVTLPKGAEIDNLVDGLYRSYSKKGNVYNRGLSLRYPHIFS